MSEVFGEEGTGKTSLALQLGASAQREGGVVVVIENENAVMVQRARTFGLDPEQVVLVEDTSIEETFKSVEAVLLRLAKMKVGPNLLVWDSIAMTIVNARATLRGSRTDGCP